ncbi:MAG: HAMP domain-containing histidine kinase [Cyclobacteriaceae bacterium]|nr:HAMP domain-containing histidine kinase [Cyclobacteriaceae bacterium]MBX2954824.1 HAMP domain-containing histidine kinase [Cyclobacteriaceae bacterium]
MKIRHRLSIFFGITSSLVLLAFGISVYYFSAQYRQKEFNIRLMKRVDITEKMFLERASFTEESYELIREQFLNILPEETEEVIQITDGWRDSLKYVYPVEFIDQLESAGVAYYSFENRQGAGRIFRLSGGDYAVLIVAVDLVGINVMKNLRTILVTALVIGVVIMMSMSYYMSNRILSPISAKIKKANTISVSNLHERLRVFNPDDEIGQLALAFNRLLDRLDEAFHAQKLFVANASHEIRNPLTVIIGEADLALDKDRPAKEYQESLKTIQSEADRLNMLVNNLLQLSTVSYNLADLKVEIITLSKLLLESKKKFDLLDPDNQVRFNFDIHADLRNLSVSGNMNLLQTAIINIFDNASKFSHNAPVEVDVERLAEHIVISVKDQGVGIAAADIPKITQPFFRADNVRKIRGTGIGIPLTVKIIELHAGKFEVQSELNKGTMVKIILPVLQLT